MALVPAHLMPNMNSPGNDDSEVIENDPTVIAQHTAAKLLNQLKLRNTNLRITKLRKELKSLNLFTRRKMSSPKGREDFREKIDLKGKIFQKLQNPLVTCVMFLFMALTCDL